MHTFQEPFKAQVRQDLMSEVRELGSQLEPKNILRMDLHCHDKNSDVPDELWGRLLRVPETWLSTKKLVQQLQEQKVDVLTITNHNNARSCWKLLDQGFDVLPAAEFTCRFPEYDVYVHVLTYGFTPNQEEKLCKLRHNIYEFLEYTADWFLPTVLPHPLYFYTRSTEIPEDLLKKFVLLFERFEILNGQRNAWQNLLTAQWIKGLDQEKIENWGQQIGIRPGQYCRDPFRKRVTGGSDDHFGFFAGGIGTLIEVPDLGRKSKTLAKSELALEALRSGNLAPYGKVADEEKLNLALLHYFSQVAIELKDPGLIRMMLHMGPLKDKLACLALGNGLLELQRHKFSVRFLKTFHKALAGKKPSLVTKLAVGKDYKPLVKMIERLAKARLSRPDDLGEVFKEELQKSFNHLLKLVCDRVSKNVDQFQSSHHSAEESFKELLSQLEMPLHVRNLFHTKSDKKGTFQLGQFLDQMSFPVLISGVLAASSFAATRVLNKSRHFLNDLAQELNCYQHPKRALWLTDTMVDKNGVSTVLQQMLAYVRKHNLPIDFLVCGERKGSEPHLHISPPIDQFSLTQFSDHPFKIPNLLEIQDIFNEGGYDRIICSTELLMGPIALYLKSCFQVPAYFYMHSDWLDYAQKNGDLEERSLDRFRRLLRFFYKQFDGIFVLNNDHQKWLTSAAMDIDEDKVFQTAHWVDRPAFVNQSPQYGQADHHPILLYAGRISEEKGVGLFPALWRSVKSLLPNAKLWIAGEGPQLEFLKGQIPDAHFFGWLDPSRLQELYRAADLFIFPSKFDTFGCVILEALSYGCPVVAFNQKGPKEIIKHGQSGYLCESIDQMVACIVAHSSRAQPEMRENCIERARTFNADKIMSDLLSKMDLTHEPAKQRREPAFAP